MGTGGARGRPPASRTADRAYAERAIVNRSLAETAFGQHRLPLPPGHLAEPPRQRLPRHDTTPPPKLAAFLPKGCDLMAGMGGARRLCRRTDVRTDRPAARLARGDRCDPGGRLVVRPAAGKASRARAPVTTE